MAQVVENTQEPDNIEPFCASREVVHGGLLELDAISQAELSRRPVRLLQVVRIDVDGSDIGAPARKLETVEARVAADVEHPLSREIRRDERLYLTPLHQGEIAQGMLWRGLLAAGKVKIVKPGSESGDGAHVATAAVVESVQVPARPAGAYVPAASRTWLSSSSARCAAVCMANTRARALAPISRRV